jgi:hypothetical protein
MRIYILRHEERTADCTYFSPLTKVGLNNSIKLVNYLKRLNITDIYCSPFPNMPSTQILILITNKLHFPHNIAILIVCFLAIS